MTTPTTGTRTRPEPIGALLGSKPHLENTRDGLVRLAISDVESQSALLPEVRRVRSMIYLPVRKAIGEVVAGREPWPLFLFGGVGTGKTRAALCLYDSCRSWREYYALPDLCNALIAASKRELWDPETGQWKTVAQIWAAWRNASLTVLDEIGARQTVSDFQYETTKIAIDAREGKPCVFISNLGPDQLATIYDDRIVSRIMAGTAIEMTGEDRRNNND